MTSEAHRLSTQPQMGDRLAAVESKLDEISAQLRILVDNQRPIVELANEMGPIANEVMSAGIDQLSNMEERGYFALMNELKYLLERVVDDYTPSDLHELADNAANILDTVKTVTQPAVMAVVRDAADAFTDQRTLTPMTPFRAYRAIKKDKNIQRGLAFTLDVLGRVGRAVSRAPRLSRAGRRLLPSSVPSPTARAKPVAAKSARGDKPKALATGEQPTFIPDGEWNRDTATQIAAELGVPELSDAHWQLIEFVRDEYNRSGATPNIRKTTNLTGVATRQVYTLFPKAPGKTMARIAGVPKPVGCL